MRLLGAACLELLLVVYEGFKLVLVVLLVENHNSTAFNWAVDDDAIIALEGLQGGMFFFGNSSFYYFCCSGSDGKVQLPSF